ncbi:nuclear membrane fusion kar5 [Fusarium beomiforme]|uniref:Nuclear membrane fusion kar5 n=1 Tax=Fusarium beomiforme TaxID=44412 RepID=A0A9P5AKI3_9HYPO|nr:nuclear membrane fusion kar5 [Fusarium beomiforme]
MSKAMALFFLALTFLMVFASEAHCFSWRPRPADAGHHATLQHMQRDDDSSALLSKLSDQRLTNVYTAALQELQDLESEPLCHRIAARLLVNNCHLLDGQDDAKVHIDSGRAARDFVDSYAASLAICDLERGSFRIPTSCSKFRESTLATLSAPAIPQLHVSTIEIDECLEGLAQSDSAWNTWVSYRHKALRFCDAARADHQKEENILLYQRITKILERLTHDIEVDMEERFQSLNRAYTAASQSVEDIGPRVQHLRTEMEMASRILRDDLSRAAEESRNVVESGLKETKVLHELLELLARSVQEKTTDIVSSQEAALQTSTMQLNNEANILLAVLNAAVSSSVSLHNQVGMTESRNADILQQQVKIEQGMGKLGELAEDLLVKYDDHESRLDKALRKAGQVLDILDTTAASASGLQSSVFGSFGLSGVWPYIICPFLSLAMGSYGLQPSLVRNIWLVGFGELMGMIVSKADSYKDSLSFVSVVKTPAAALNDALNMTLPRDNIPKNL